jgi:hypothetical protein
VVIPRVRVDFQNYERDLRLAICQHSAEVQMRLGLCLFSEAFS